MGSKPNLRALCRELFVSKLDRKDTRTVGRDPRARGDLTLTGWTRPGYYTGALPSLFVNLAATTRERGFLTL